MRGLAAGMSIHRIMMGQARDSSEDHRYEVLLSGAEDGGENAIELLRKLADGECTLVQAVKALGSQEAYDRLRLEGGEKIRKDPVYVMVDAEGRVGGLVMKSITTLRNAASLWQDQWDEVPAEARRKIRKEWLELVASMPPEIKSFKA
jgi:hypothetical protein